MPRRSPSTISLKNRRRTTPKHTKQSRAASFPFAAAAADGLAAVADAASGGVLGALRQGC